MIAWFCSYIINPRVLLEVGTQVEDPRENLLHELDVLADGDLALVAEFISPIKVYTFSSIGD